MSHCGHWKPSPRPIFAVLTLLTALTGTASVADPQQLSSRQATVTVYYRAGGPNQDGYEFATVDVAYKFGVCHGTVVLQYGLKPQSLSVQRFYWFQGTRYDIPDTLRPQLPTSLLFEGRVVGPGGTRDFSVRAVPRGISCFDGFQLAGTDQYWSKGTPAAEKERRLNALNVVTAAAGFSAPAYQSDTVERYILNLRRQAELEEKEKREAEARREAEEKKLAEKKEAEERAQKEQEEREARAAEEKAREAAAREAEEREAAKNQEQQANATREREERVKAQRAAAERERAEQEAEEEARRNRDFDASIAESRRKHAAYQKQLEEDRRRNEEQAVMHAAAAAAPLVQGAMDFATEANKLVDNWVDLELTARMLTDFRSNGGGYSLDARFGGLFFFHFGLGWFESPELVKYVVRDEEYGGGHSLRIIDGRGVINTYLDMGGGFALPVNRTVIIRILDVTLSPTVYSIPAIAGLLDNGKTGVGFGFSLTSGVTYRFEGSGAVLGAQAQLRKIVYEESIARMQIPESGYSTSFDLNASSPHVALSLGLSAMWRFDR